MKINILLFILMLNVISTYSQELNKIVFDEKANKKILLGNCNREGFKNEEFNHWFDSTYTAYKVDEATLANTDLEKLAQLKIKVVMATWCSDSRREMPHLFKILDFISFNDKQNLSLILVNSSKEGTGIDIKSLNIQLVPTIIFYYNDKEVGRIIETPKLSLEKDIQNILLTIN